jgi:plasmid stability protein
MSKLVLENLPDEIMEQIRQLARQHNQSINDQALTLLLHRIHQYYLEICPCWTICCY